MTHNLWGSGQFYFENCPTRQIRNIVVQSYSCKWRVNITFVTAFNLFFRKRRVSASRMRENSWPPFMRTETHSMRRKGRVKHFCTQFAIKQMPTFWIWKPEINLDLRNGLEETLDRNSNAIQIRLLGVNTSRPPQQDPLSSKWTRACPDHRHTTVAVKNLRTSGTKSPRRGRISRSSTG